jgi:hypothetical protein
LIEQIVVAPVLRYCEDERQADDGAAKENRPVGR